VEWKAVSVDWEADGYVMGKVAADWWVMGGEE
jgi:hypothetical protein